MNKLNMRQKQALETKQHINNVAMEIFKKKRFDEVSVNEICQAAGVSTGAFYHHYPSKEHLLIEKYKLVNNMLWDSIDMLTETDPIERLIEYIGVGVQSAEDATIEVVTEVYRVWLTLRMSFPLSFKNSDLANMSELVADCQAKGRFNPELDPKEIALEIDILVHGVIYHWCKMNGTFSVKEKAIKIIRPYIEYYSLPK